MPNLQELIAQISKLDPLEREELTLVLIDEIFLDSKDSDRRSAEYSAIVATPNICGGEARIIRTRIPVWVIERMRQQGFSEVQILQSFPRLRAVDLVQALAYASNHRNEIEKAIVENE